jgi:hypothetical protein
MTAHGTKEVNPEMIVYMIDAEGRIRIGQFVRAAMAWQGLSGPKIDAGGRISRATVDRVKRADPRISDVTLLALGDVLGLPRKYLLYIGTRDAEKIRTSGADPDLIRVTLEMLEEPLPDPAPRSRKRN